VNFLSHFYLTNLIIDRQAAARRSTLTAGQLDLAAEGQMSRSLRVVNVASTACARGRTAHLHDAMTSPLPPATTSSSLVMGGCAEIYQQYADSKLALLLFTRELNFRHANDDIVCLAAHPGTLQYYYIVRRAHRRVAKRRVFPGTSRISGHVPRVPAWLFLGRKMSRIFVKPRSKMFDAMRQQLTLNSIQKL